ncbi:PD-(D/E)XK nuclease family transposase [Candidatus Arcanobacter lacustris]|uniref:PD-(D/E)XK nuclease family transposase n=1 Tax=Candidatus Arcanibacter lacustris TaxID=1607817 RepID=A0A0F5MND0_9RICK|nr:PD-(D/E)XK nuclease family transposase [Candidatus Arcanobacter lacustris]
MAAPRYLDATNDVAFKKVFSNKEILIDFLNSMLQLTEGNKITELHFVPQEEIPDLGQGKRSIFDIKVLDQSGFWYIIEMQNRPDEFFLKRVQVYASSTYSNQTLKGKDYMNVLPVLVVAIVNGTLFPDEIGCISRHTTREEATNTQHLFELSYVFIELGKFIKSEKELEAIEDFWLFYLAKSTEVKHPPAKVTDANILKAYEVLERFNWDDASYDAYIRAKLLADTERLEIEDAFSKGEAKGKEEGLAEGELKGKLEIAKNLIAKGFDENTILEVTGLTIGEFKKYLP